MGSEEPSRERPNDGTEMSGILILLQLGGYVGLLFGAPTWSPPASSAASAPNSANGSAGACHSRDERLVCGPWRSALAVTAVLQSSTATGLMATSFAARGALGLAPALAVMHDCSDCFRLERLPGGPCTHWKPPPCHGAHQ
jgi:hypothetical protein